MNNSSILKSAHVITFDGSIAASPCAWCGDSIYNKAYVLSLKAFGHDFEANIIFCQRDHMILWQELYNVECVYDFMHQFSVRAAKSEGYSLLSDKMGTSRSVAIDMGIISDLLIGVCKNEDNMP